LITEEVAEKLSKLRFKHLRLAYDNITCRTAVKNAIDLLEKHSINRRKILVYTMFNYTDTPADLFERIKDLLSWGVWSYPMRYQPLNCLEKNVYISSNWTKEEIQMVQAARRVLGFSGTFPPYEGLVNKFQNAKDFNEAFSLRIINEHNKPVEKEKSHIQICKHRWGSNLDWRAV
jgi:hypothetical protein